REAETEPAPATAPEVASREREQTRAAGSPETGGETMVVEDGTGTFVIRKAPVGQGPANAGGPMRPGAPSPDRDDQGRTRAQAGANLRLSFSDFEQTFGADELRAEREAYIAQRKSRTRGQNRQQSWRKFRAAIEN